MHRKYNLSFTKAAASGNDFLIIDNRSGELDARELDYSEMARELCPRRVAVGADGILVLESSDKADFRMRIINPDGSEVEMCGNGARCSALYGASCGWGDALDIETRAGIIKAGISGNRVKLKMSDPKDAKMGINLGVGQSMMSVHYINTGVPHVVHLVDDLEAYHVNDVGRMIRQHSLFAPDGTNADFVGNVEGDSAAVRTYERGVEDETLACGTGMVASAVVLGLLGYAKSPVKILSKSGETVTVHFNLAGGKATDVYLEGAANIIYEGRI